MPQVITSGAPRINTFALDDMARRRAQALNEAEFGFQKQQTNVVNQRYDQRAADEREQLAYEREQRQMDSQARARQDALNNTRYDQNYSRTGEWHDQGRADTQEQNTVRNEDTDLKRSADEKRYADALAANKQQDAWAHEDRGIQAKARAEQAEDRKKNSAVQGINAQIDDLRANIQNNVTTFGYDHPGAKAQMAALVSQRSALLNPGMSASGAVVANREQAPEINVVGGNPGGEYAEYADEPQPQPTGAASSSGASGLVSEAQAEDGNEYRNAILQQINEIDEKLRVSTLHPTHREDLKREKKELRKELYQGEVQDENRKTAAGNREEQQRRFAEQDSMKEPALIDAAIKLDKEVHFKDKTGPELAKEIDEQILLTSSGLPSGWEQNPTVSSAIKSLMATRDSEGNSAFKTPFAAWTYIRDNAIADHGLKTPGAIAGYAAKLRAMRQELGIMPPPQEAKAAAPEAAAAPEVKEDDGIHWAGGEGSSWYNPIAAVRGAADALIKQPVLMAADLGKAVSHASKGLSADSFEPWSEIGKDQKARLMEGQGGLETALKGAALPVAELAGARYLPGAGKYLAGTKAGARAVALGKAGMNTTAGRTVSTVAGDVASGAKELAGKAASKIPVSKALEAFKKVTAIPKKSLEYFKSAGIDVNKAYSEAYETARDAEYEKLSAAGRAHLEALAGAEMEAEKAAAKSMAYMVKEAEEEIAKSTATAAKSRQPKFNRPPTVAEEAQSLKFKSPPARNDAPKVLKRMQEEESWEAYIKEQAREQERAKLRRDILGARD